MSGGSAAALVPGQGDVIHVPGYAILRLLGRGGMGAVWEAFEHRLERRVALKVQNGSATPERVAQLWAEAKLAARIAHPGVVSVHDVGTTLEGQPYYTMDLIEGLSLREALRDKPFSPARAVAVAIEIVDAVAAAHACGVVHRDLKPGNILIDVHDKVRVLDFGIAERLDRPRDDGQVKGTPPYMSPEQISGDNPTEANDIYSLGVILYEMIAGQRPFMEDTLQGLLFIILTESPPPLSRHCPLVPKDIERVCLRSLEKRPKDRFPSARALHEALVAIREGRPLDEAPAWTPPSYIPRPIELAAAPQKLSRENAPCYYRWSFTFDAPPETLWQYITDTDRIGKLLGWPALEFTSKRAPEGHHVRMATVRFLGASLSWEVNPYAWVRLREFVAFQGNPRGPVQALWFQFFFRPAAENKTEVTVEIRAVSQGALGWVMAFVQFKLWFPRKVERFFQRLSDVIAGGDPRLDVYEPPHAPSTAARARVERAEETLAGEHGFPGELVAALSHLLLYAPNKKIERLRPFALADAWGFRREEVLDLFLHAARAGLLDVAWDLICAECRLPYETTPSLQKVVRVGACTGCGAAYEADLARSIELIFRPHRAVRDIRPETYCVQAPSDRPHIVAQQVLAPGERRTFTFALERGAHRLVATRAARAFDLTVSVVGTSSTCSVRLTPEGIEGRPFAVLAGDVAIELENATLREEIFRVEDESTPGNRVTAAVALNHPSFHQLFSKETIAYGDHLAVSQMAFLFVEAERRAELFAARGDAGALQILSEIEETVRKEVDAQNGSLIKADPTEDLLVAAFPEAKEALRAALELTARASTEPARVRLRVSVHKGRCIALSRDDHIYYFGETLERGASLLAFSATGIVAVSREVADDRDAARVILDSERHRVAVVSGREAVAAADRGHLTLSAGAKRHEDLTTGKLVTTESGTG